MPKSVNQKQKLLFLLDYLRQNTDETHTVTTPQIIDHLAANGIRAERKSIYNDIQTLCDYGYDIIRTEGAHAGYRIADRTFELPEVKLLVDLVQSSKFITTKKSRQLIGKLEQLVSKNDAKKLQRQVLKAPREKRAQRKPAMKKSITAWMSSTLPLQKTGRSVSTTSTGMSEKKCSCAKTADSIRSAPGFLPGMTRTIILLPMTRMPGK